MSDTLKNKIAVITGASRGIGRASALALAQEGVNIVATSRTADALNSLVKELHHLGVKGIAVPADLTKEEEVDRLRSAVFSEFSHVDILVNNVGVAKYTSLLNLSAEDYDWMMNTNMRSTFLCTRAFLPNMLERKSGSIIFIGSQAGLRGYPNETIYCATKFAQTGFAQSLDGEVREHGIKVNIIAPGGVYTDFAIGTGRTEGDPRLGEFLDADDVARAVVFAADQSPKSRILLVGMRPMVESL